VIFNFQIMKRTTQPVRRWVRRASCNFASECSQSPINAPHRIPSELVERWKTPEAFEQVRKNIRIATTIPPEAYFDPGYHEAEMQQIFGKQWFCVGHTAELPRAGDTKLVDVGSQSFIITHDKKGGYNCFYNVCRHRGARLVEDCEGVVNRKRLNCPYHWWSYRLTGELVSTPFFKEDEGFKKKDYSLLKVKCETFMGMIFINQDRDAPPLREKYRSLLNRFEQYPLHEMTLLGSQSYDLDVDWKLLAENFMEWYHVGPVHPELAKFSTMDKHYMNSGEGQYVGFVTRPVTNCGGPADTDLFHPTPNTNEYDQTTAFFYHLFPNVSVTVYPHSVYTLVMLPQGPGKSKETLYLLQHPDSRLEQDCDVTFKQKADALMKFVTNVNDEDIWIVNRVSKGVRNSKYRGGRFSPDMEETCYRFQNMIADSMIDRNLVFPAEVTDYYEHVMRPHEFLEKMTAQGAPLADYEPLLTEAGDAVFTLVDDKTEVSEKFSVVEFDPESGVTVVMDQIDDHTKVLSIDPETESVQIVELGDILTDVTERIELELPAAEVTSV